MKLYSTNNPDNIVDLKEAVLKSLAVDKGLYMPMSIEKMDSGFFEAFYDYSFNDIAFNVSKHLLGDYINHGVLDQLITNAFDFDAPLYGLGDNIYSLELWHGPSLAFKDFGARYMAQLMSYFNRDSNQKLTILVATSGDTGGAVASGFHKTEGIDVIILYPSGKVSPLQEKQLTTWGDNIRAVEVQGTFDDCQRMVKTAFLDDDLKAKYNLSSANSINIARLIPQSFYYFYALKQLGSTPFKKTVCVPSGNFGNLTAGVMAKKMGLDIHHFIAATNDNNIVPDYIKTGEYNPKPSVATISNAMDVGDPSNFPRLLQLYGSTWNMLKEDMSGFHLNDEDTRSALKEAHDTYGYTCDPHGAIGFKAIQEYLKGKTDHIGIFFETAHPAKFLETVETTLERKIEVPKRLLELQDLKKEATLIDTEYESFKGYLMG